MLEHLVSNLAKALRYSQKSDLVTSLLPRTVGSRTLSRPLCSSHSRRQHQRQQRHITTAMAQPPLESPAFTGKVVSAMRSLYPEELADRSWDNVGLLLENINRPQEPEQPTVLVTNDLTIKVAEEAIRRKASVIVSYHPFIFRPMKAVGLSDPHQRILLQLAQHNIAVYCPHTAVDAAPGGMNDWLADMLNGRFDVARRSVVQSITSPLPQGFEGAGYGRLVELARPVSLSEIVKAYSEGLGMRYLMVARPKTVGQQMNPVRSVAVCAGSGYDVLKNSPADLLVTGEMTHHNALKATMEGKCVITVFHSNSERKFLRDRLQPQLQELLRRDIQAAEVLVSEEDEDPFEIWDVRDLAI